MELSKFRVNVKKVRIAKECTAKDLAIAILSKHKKRIHDIEEGRGKPTLDEVIKICEALEQNMDDMINKECELSIHFK